MGTREDILNAADRIMRTEGYARATTKQIATEAGYSEATLYKHFRDKTEIFVRVLGERLPELERLLGELTEWAGRNTVWANLTRLTRTALDFYIESFPLAASVFSERELLTAHRERLHELGSGPEYTTAEVARYLRMEREHGRIRRTADPESAAALLLGACFQQAFLINFTGDTLDGESRDTLAAGLARTLLDGLD